MTLKYKKIPTKNGRIIENPKYQTIGSACFDLVANIDENLVIKPEETVKIASGIAIEIENSDYVGLVFARSGLSLKHGIVLTNGVGVIDSDYRGEILIALTNNSKKEYTITQGERVAQLGLFPVSMAKFELCEELSDTSRGGQGFGSTGK